MKTILTLIMILVVGLLFYSFEKEEINCSNIVSYSDEKHQYSGVPPAGKTGAPGDGLCYDCHSFEILNDTLGSISMNFNGGINFYKPDSTYLINVKVKQFGNTIFGFETTALDSNTSKTGSYNILDSAKTAYQTLSGREYISHKNVLSNLSNDSLEWQFEWTAPSSNVGVVTIYSAGVTNPTFISIAAGKVYNDSLKIYPDSSITSVNDFPLFSDIIGIYPNPTKNGSTTISYLLREQGDITISIYGINGKFIKLITKGIKSKGSHHCVFSTKGIAEGVYFLKLKSEKGTKTKKIIITK